MEHAQSSQPTQIDRDGLAIAFELVFTPAIFGFFGFGLDRWLGSGPWLMVVLTAVAFVTVVAVTLWRYNLEMEANDAERRARQRQRGPRPARWEVSEATRARTAGTADLDSAGAGL